jgi:ABC-type glycerol-3-phosphate transport system permease component
MAGVLLSLVPVVLVCVIFFDYDVSGLTAGATRG